MGTNDTTKHVRLAQHLRDHHGAIESGELRRLGFDPQAVSRLVARQQLVRVHQGVYRSGYATPEDTTLLACGLLAVGPDAAVSRAAAAHHSGYIDFAPSERSIVVPRRGVRPNLAGFSVHQTESLPPEDVRQVNGIRCTRPRRTILDLAAVTRTNAEYKLVRRALRQATVRHKGLPALLQANLEERRRFPGSRVLASLLDEHVPEASLTRSALEESFLDLCRDAGLPIPETNVMVEGFEVDALFRLAKVIVELDTYAFHGDVRAFENDRARDAHLTVAGFRTVRVTPRRVGRDAGHLVRQLRSLVMR